ncbi:MAG: Uma2 family endonuclease [Elainellaceae cyanobacterium]
MTVADTPADDIRLPPCDLWSDEPPLESDWHRDQIDLLLACLRFWWRDRSDYYASGNLTIYYSEDKITTRDFRGPDFFVVLGTENRPRRSWMTWVEGGKYPNVIIELLSNSTASVDRNEKKLLYQDTFRTPEYLWFHPETLEFKGFRLMAGNYQPIEPNSRAWLWSQQLDLYLGIHEDRLRFFTSDEILVPTPQERAEQEAQRAEQEVQQRRQAEYQVAALQAKLRELGVDPDTLA